MPRTFYTPIDLAEYLGTDAPAAPADGVSLFARQRAGRVLPTFRGPSGLIMPLSGSPLWAVKSCYFGGVGNGTQTQVVNYSAGASGTAGTVNVATTDLFSSVRRIRYTSAAAAASAAGNRHNIAQFWRGNAAGRGGFFFVAQFGVATFQAGMAAFVGLGPAAALGNVNPNTLTHCCGFAFDDSAGQTTWRFQSNDGAGTATQVDTGLASNVSGTNWYEARMFCAPNGAAVGWSLEQMNTGSLVEGSATTDLPGSTTFMGAQITGNTKAGTAALVVDISFLYVESDF
jgi:hypothetical protein